MKEQTYGWYPPAKSIWNRSGGQPDYQKECLYKHWSSRYNSQPGVTTPQAPTHLRPSSNPSSAKPHHHTRPSGYAKFQNEDFTICGSRPPSVGSVRTRTESPSRKSQTSPKKSWAMRLASTEITVPNFSIIPAPPSQPRISVSDIPVSLATGNSGRSRQEPVAKAPSLVQRAQSASVSRPKVSHPPRPTRSAGPERVQTQVKGCTSIPEPFSGGTPPTPGSPRLSERSCMEGLPEDHQLQGDSSDSEDDTESVPESHPDFDETREKYGWRFEIPGDPLNLKKPCIARRLPYTMSLPVPRVAPNPPRGNMMNYDTYFLNTIPRKPLSFTIHQEWISEVLHAKRVELQKRHGMDYNFKEYAFLY